MITLARIRLGWAQVGYRVLPGKLEGKRLLG
jgi:hypothetical protein